jgi:hypothetical protein
MATERQIAANRRNSQKSTGPRSAPGKRRAAWNSFRHGMRADGSVFGPEGQEHLETAARKIAGNLKSAVLLNYAREIARADLQLLRARPLQLAYIEFIRTFGSLDSTPEPPMLSARTIIQWAPVFEATGRFGLGLPPDIEASMPQTEPDRTAVSISRCLYELTKLDRYQRSAVASRSRVLRRFKEYLALASKKQIEPNEANFVER